MTLNIQAIPVLSDNYAWLLHDTAQNVRAIVDPGEAGPIESVLGDAQLDWILLTHHHADHTAGTDALRRRYGAHVAGAASERRRLPQLDLALSDGDTLMIGAERGEVIATPGHADGHISYYFASVPVLFSGDALFSLGCGRLLEGSAAQLFESLHRYDRLPDDTLVYCGHEYTKSNAAFARYVDPDNSVLKARAAEVERLRAASCPTVPSRLGEERAANPFLRAKTVGEFARLRREKDNF
ncbi:hydroxyacylglutathione hydrolase [Kozakia baliensis]|uniref:hydroxyacylglutathione hydrolase n=1 Tax=Kozakia baliensis TaxID=153496 RepID=UPI0008799CA4|nr:hydroxyacylglutathione hydrolase [Kozakia baliensis]AOX20155.1 hydroxyacylglutathione hydrolase [Kozakia baliensis]